MGVQLWGIHQTVIARVREAGESLQLEAVAKE
jgi:hypothetical protein